MLQTFSFTVAILLILSTPAILGRGDKGAPDKIHRKILKEVLQVKKALGNNVGSACSANVRVIHENSFDGISFPAMNVLTRTLPENAVKADNLIGDPNGTFTAFYQSNYWLGPDNSTGYFILDFGCIMLRNVVKLVNTHNAYFQDRSTRAFRVYFSESLDGPWGEPVVNRTLLYRLGLERFPLESFYFAPKYGRYAKFEILDFYWKGGGLQFFNMIYEDKMKTKVGHTIEDGPYGVPLGTPWTDEDVHQNGFISEIKLRSDSYVDSIRTKYGDVWGKKHGGRNGSVHTINPESKIFLVMGRSGYKIDELSFWDDGNVHGPVGGDGGAPFVSTNAGCHLSYFSGTSGSNTLNSLTFHWECP